jgi:hypothetical protein
MTWVFGATDCQDSQLPSSELYIKLLNPQYYGRLFWGYKKVPDSVDTKLVDDMARRIGQLVLALLPCTAVLADVPVDPNLKPCGDAYYYPSKVDHIRSFMKPC